MKDRAERIQDDTYAQALTVESALVSSLAGIKAAKEAAAMRQPVDSTLLEEAIEDHRAAHVRWENLIVSENSMGFHNPTEVGSELAVALNLAQSAQESAASGTNCGPGCGRAAGAVPDGLQVPGVPLTIHRDATGNLEMTWGSSCVSGDTDFAIYEGTLGSFTSHTPKTCSTGGSTSAVVQPGTGNTYYLVVPHNSVWEGSHGYRADGKERPRGPSACFTQAVGACGG